MSVINFNTAKPLRKGDNGEYLVLCKPLVGGSDLTRLSVDTDGGVTGLGGGHHGRSARSANDVHSGGSPAKLFHFPKPKQLLFQFPKTEQGSDFVIKTVPLGVVSSASKMVWPRKPVRRIVARTPERIEVSPNYFITSYIDTLSCGHQIHCYAFEVGKKKRGCQLCLDGLQISVSERKAA